MRYYATYQHYRKAWQDAKYRTPTIPLNLDIELSTVCNLQCPFCFTQDKAFKLLKLKPYMEKDLALYIIEQAHFIGIPALKFNWRGEATLHPDFTEIMKFAKKKDFYDIIINTNGNVPDSALEGLKLATKIIVSLDTFGKDQYAKLRKKGDLRTVINTINYLIDSGHNNISVRRVLTKENNNEDFHHIAKTVFGDKVKTSEHHCFDRNTLESYSITKLDKKRTYCGYPSQRLVIGTNGDVFPCCVDYFETMKLANIEKDDLQTIWEDIILYNLRKNLKQNIFFKNTQCLDCTSFMAYNVPERELIEPERIEI